MRYIFGQLKLASRVRWGHDGFDFTSASLPPHDFDLDRRLDQYRDVKRLVYLERDPRDVMVSLFHQVTGRFGDTFDWSGDLSSFIRDEYFGAHNLARFRELWQAVVASNDYLAITYEQLHADPEHVIREVTDYYGFAVGDAKIVRAVAASGFAQMSEVEQSNEFPGAWLRPRNDSPKMRRGIVGAHRDELDPSDIEYLDEVFGLRPRA